MSAPTRNEDPELTRRDELAVSSAAMSGAAAAIIVFVLSVVLGSSGLVGGAFTAVWHGAVAYGLTGLAGTVGGSRKRRDA